MICLHIGIGFGLATLIKSSSDQPWEFLPKLPAPDIFLSVTVAIHITGAYLAWKHYHEDRKRRGTIGKAAMILLQAGSTFALAWSLPLFAHLILTEYCAVS